MRNKEMQKQFNDQLERDLQDCINTFLTNEEYSDIKELYKNNFDVIVSYINKFGVKSAIEDIANLKPMLSSKIMLNLLFLKEINTAIKKFKLTKSEL